MDTEQVHAAPAFDANDMLRFAEHVRSMPDDGNGDAAALAQRFGLPEEIVRASLRIVAEGRPRQSSRTQAGRKGFWELLGAMFGYVGSAIYSRPLVSTAIGSLAFFGFYRYFDAYAGASKEAWAITSLLAGFAFLLAVNLARGQFRYAVLSSPVAVGAALASSYLVDVIYGKTVVRAEKVSSIFMNSIAMMPLLAAFLSFGAVFGAMWRIRRQAQQEQRQDRLQLLQRVFDLQDRLAGNAAEARKDMRLRSVLRLVRRRWLLAAVAAGTAMGLVYVTTRMIFGPSEKDPSFLQQIVFVLQLILNMSVYPAVGFVAGSWFRGAVAGVVAYVTFHALLTIPVAGLGFRSLVDAYSDPRMLVTNLANAAILLLMSALGGVGAAIDDQTEHRKRVESDDQAAVLTEIIRLQQMLETGEAPVCVMVADCVQSTRMKQGAHPLAVEISFREFHDFLDREVLRHGGTVHSTAGDSAIAEFHSSAAAFAAARQIQTLMPEFNRAANKLKVPFRVRIGLHSGSVHGGLEKVMFTNVIDIAAHIEKSAPVGGIAATKEVVESLPEMKFAKLADEVDGHQVFLALNPTLD